MSDFTIREHMYDSFNKLPMGNVRLAVEDTLLEFGTKGTVDLTKYGLTEKEILMVKAIIREHMYSIQRDNERKKRAVENGRKGGLKGGKIAGRGRPKKQESNGQA